MSMFGRRILLSFALQVAALALLASAGFSQIGGLLGLPLAIAGVVAVPRRGQGR